MKKITYNIIAILTLGMLIFAGCTKDFDEINEDPNAPTSVLTAYLFTNVERTLMDNVWDEWWNGRFGLLYSQYWSQVVYTEEGRYQPRTSITNTYWATFYRMMSDLENIIDLNTDAETSGEAAASGPNMNQIAVARILKAYTFHMLTDVWGDIPYADALMGAENTAPAYTPQEDIYADLLKELDEAQAQIDVAAGNIDGDVIYGGDMAMWKKFANSLRMRVALRTSNVSSTFAATVNAANTAGAFTSSDDNAYFTFDASAPNYNPLYEAYYIDNRADFAVSKTLIDIMKASNDPRLPFYAALPVDPKYSATYEGMPYGMTNDDATKYSGASGAHVSRATDEYILAPDAKATLMNYAEVCFILSEVNGFDQTWYEAGIRASMEEWGIPTADIDTYIAAAPAASAATVGMEKWIANYMQGLQGWFEVRRTGYPALAAPDDATAVSSAGLHRNYPSRRPYPTDEQVLNSANYEAAVAAQGADNLDTNVWWDTK